MAERILAAELSHHLKSQSAQGKTDPHRNGSSPETVITLAGDGPLDLPRDRRSTFEPQWMAQYPQRLPGFEDHVIRMEARGISVREIRRHLLDLLELYGLEISPDLISTLTDKVWAEVEPWQTRPLERLYSSTILS